MKFYHNRDWIFVALPELSAITGLLQGGNVTGSLSLIGPYVEVTGRPNEFI